MPLLDHFRPPLSQERHWESFHTTWAGSIADALNEQWLPEGYFAEEQLHPTVRIEIDVATFEEASPDSPITTTTAVASRATWRPAAPTWTAPMVFTEGVELLVYHSEGGPTLVGAIELVPANKDRPAARKAFAAKCATYLHAGVGLLVVDVVTTRSANLHNELLDLLAISDCTIEAELYAVAYRPVKREGEGQVEVWPADLAVGRPMRDLPLWLGPDLVVPVSLESTYLDACRRRRITY